MFPPKKSFIERLYGRLDLAIDFLTLGEYGLDTGPVGPAPAPECAGRSRPLSRARQIELRS